MAKPIVDGLERDLDGKASVVRLDIMSAIGRQAASLFGVRGLPTLLLVDGQGEEVLRQVGIIQASKVNNQVEQMVTVP